MGVACVGASRKSFQTFRKLEKEETVGTRTQQSSKVTIQSKRFTRILQDSVATKEANKQSPIKVAFPKGGEESKSVIIESEQKQNNPNTLVEFIKQKPQSPIQQQVQKSRICNIHPRIAKRYFNNSQM